MVWCRMLGWACCVSLPIGLAYRRRSPPRWPALIAARGCMRPGRCSPIWRPRSPTARTASTESANSVVTESTCSARRPRRPRCGGWSMNESMLLTYPGCGQREPPRGRRPGKPEPHPHRVAGCTSTSMPLWCSITPTTRPGLRRPGRKRSDCTRCWRSWTVRRSPVARLWAGCCATATPAPIPPVITSSSFNRH